ncbi:protein DDB_G0287365-like [Saccostrea cucullata]|uniref:protein DDB_G0287365-like n=1 Tax=Saccostrea cuccullata TaxID=36930 RepID=UPI002ED0A141
MRTIFLAALLCCGGRALGSCPDDASDLVKWSSSITASKNDNITISQPTLLDVSPPELFGITIASGGRLVWSRKGDFSIRTQYIWIQGGGELHIGSEECQFDRKARITLLGEPGELNIPSFGEKFIGVDQGGVLELHGKDKLSWTKLSGHAQKAQEEIYNHRETEISFQPGLYVYHFREAFPSDFNVNTDSGFEYVGKIHRRLNFRSQRKTNAAIVELKDFIEGIPNGDIFAIATQKNFFRRDLSALYDVIDALGNTNSFRRVQKDDAYVAVGKKGSSFFEDHNSDISEAQSTEAKVTYTAPEREREIMVMSKNHLRDGKSRTEFMVLNTLQTKPIIHVVDDVSSWNAGDKIFITSTDYDWRQVEEFTIVPCTSVECSTNTIRLDRPFKNDHYGEIYKRVDMRAEVGLMTRHILIDSEVSKGNSNGGHVKFIKGFGSVRVEGVELTNLGQPLITGRYPLHYHMCEDLADTSLYPVRSYLRMNSIHHSQFRCVTIHGTHNSTVTDNVCYDTVGHGFFIEDGGEKDTYLRGNLGLGQRRFRGDTVLDVTGAIPTDTKKGPVTFWVTSPKTTLINNVAAGGEGIGMWFVYPDIPTGPSHDKNFMAEKEARRTKITKYLNNVHHSYVVAGLFVDNIEQQDLTVKGYNKYNPRLVPTDPSSPRVPAVFEGITAYKNRMQNVWIRGTPIIVKKSSFSDSLFGATLIKESNVWMEFTDNVVIGYSDNMGNPMNSAARSFPSRPSRPIAGYRVHKGPVYVRNTWFGGFESTDVYNASAITNRQCPPNVDPQNQVENVLFGFDDTPGSRFHFTDGRNCDEREAMFTLKDVGNSLTQEQGTSDMTLVTNHPFHTTGECKLRNSWDMAYCPYNYGGIKFMYPSDNDLNVYRTDGGSTFPMRDITSKTFITILGDATRTFQYLALIEDGMPATVGIRGESITKSNSFVMALCVPRDAKFTFRYSISKVGRIGTEKVNSRDEVLADTTGGKYFFDSNVGVIFFKMVNDVDFAEGEMSSCPSKHCPFAFIRIDSGSMTDSDCSSRFFSQTSGSYVQADQGNPSVETNVIPADSESPPQTMGAGSTYPGTAQ